MEKSTFTVVLADGTQLSGLELNGNNFISKTPITKEVFAGKLGHVTITGNAEEGAGLVGAHEHMELVRCEYDAGLGGYAFALREISAAEFELAKMKANIAYTAMMSGVDLDD